MLFMALLKGTIEYLFSDINLKINNVPNIKAHLYVTVKFQLFSKLRKDNIISTERTPPAE